MRHTLLICGIACLILSGVARRAEAQPDTLWTRAYDFGVNSTLQAAIELRNGGFAAAGYTAQGQELNALVMAIDPLGDTLWTRILGDANANEQAFDIAELSSGTLVVGGYDYSQPSSCMIVGFSPSGQQLWSKPLQAGSQGSASAILPQADGGFWILGRKTLPGRNLDFWLIRCDNDGDTLFSRTFGTTGTDVPDEILQGRNGRIELVGSTRAVGSTTFDFYHVAVDAQGNFIDEEIFGGTDWEQVSGAAIDSTTGDIIMAGEIRNGSDRDGYAVRIDPSGIALWDDSYEDGRLSERIGGVAPYLEGGALFAGQSGGSVGSGQLWLMSVGINGDTAWTWTDTSPGRAFEDLARIADGGFVACGKANIGNRDRALMWRISPPSGISGEVRDRLTNEVVAGVRVQVAELPQYSVTDTVGRFTLALPAGIYTLYTGGPCFSGDTLHSIMVVANENTYADITVGVAHMTMSHSTINVLARNHEEGYSDLVVMNEGSGDLVYSFETIAQYPAENWLSIEPPSGRLAPGDTLVAQVVVAPDTSDDGTYDYFGEIRLHTNSCPETLRVIQVLAVVLDAEETPALPSEFALYPAFPNPFNSTTTLRFGLDRDADVTLSIYDVTGRQVATLLSHQRLSAGEHHLSYEANGLASGIYFVRLQDQLRSQTQRLLYIR